MPTSIFVNLPVRDLAAAVAYYKALGFERSGSFTGDSAACMVVSDAINVMLWTRETFQSLSQAPIAEPKEQIQCFHTLSCDSREAVDAIANAGIAAGGVQHSAADDYGSMYSRPVIDLDRHVWNYLWMEATPST